MVHRNWDDKPEPETTIGLLILPHSDDNFCGGLMYNIRMTNWLIDEGVNEYTITEGTSSPNSLMWLLKLIKDHAPDAQKILEIGLNLGHSSDAMLEHTDAQVVSFDLKQFGYSDLVENYFNKYYSDRHTIIGVIAP